jgi:aminoglycoside phosphotransferase (APT) family kinase protein
MGHRNLPEGFRIPDDPELPQLASALQLKVMNPLLPISSTASPYRVAYIRYKPGTNCIVLYEARQPNGLPSWAYAKIVPGHPGMTKTGKHSSCRHVVDPGLYLSSFPCDLEMPSLDLAMRLPEGQRVLTRLVASSRRHLFQPYWTSWRPIRYKPERRCVLQGRYDEAAEPGTSREFYARFYSGAEATRTAGWHRYLRQLDRKSLGTPRLLGYSERHKVVLVDRVRGEPLRSFLEGHPSKLSAAIELSARALADWHRLPPPPQAPPLPDPRDELAASVRTVSALIPECSPLVRELSRMLVRAAPRSPSPQALLHGDFYYDQVLLRKSGRVGFLDLDELALGHPAHDLANFCAHLHALAIKGAMTEHTCVEATERFVETYQGYAKEPVPQALLQWNLSMALLRLAPAPFRRFDFNWDHQTTALLQRAMSAAGAAKCC